MIIPYYSHDCALCSCPPTRNLKGIRCIEVERDKAAKTDRCLQCGTVWTMRKYRKDPAQIISRVLVEAA